MSNVQNGTFNKFVTTDTTANSLVVGGSTASATSGTGGIKAGPIVCTTLAASAAITGATTATIDTGTIAGLMPSTGAFTVKAIHQMTGTTDNLSGFFAVKSNIDGATLNALYGYAYSTIATPSTIGTTTAILGNAQHNGTGTLTLVRGVFSNIDITSSGGGTDAIAYSASLTGQSGAGSGTFTNAYGFYVGTFGSGFTNKYSFYSSDSTATMSQAGIATFASSVKVAATQKLYLDGGGDTYLYESAANDASMIVGNATALRLTDTLTYAPNVYNDTSGSAANVFIDSNGRLYRSTSSLRYKTALEPLGIEDAKAILRLSPFTYRSKTDPVTAQRFPGVAAEEVATTVPLLAVYDDAGRPEAVDYARMGLYLLQVVKDHEARMAALEAR